MYIQKKHTRDRRPPSFAICHRHHFSPTPQSPAAVSVSSFYYFDKHNSLNQRDVSLSIPIAETKNKSHKKILIDFSKKKKKNKTRTLCSRNQFSNSISGK